MTRHLHAGDIVDVKIGSKTYRNAEILLMPGTGAGDLLQIVHDGNVVGLNISSVTFISMTRFDAATHSDTKAAR